MNCHGFIFNWVGQEQKTRDKEMQLSILDKLTVITSGSRVGSNWIDVGEDSYFGAQFLKAVEVFDGDVLFHVQGDVSFNDWGSIIQSAAKQFEDPNCGIYAPNVDFTYWTSKRVDLGSLGGDTNLRLVSNTDCSCWFVRKACIEEFKSKFACCFYDNKYGWGADGVLCDVARRLGLNVIRDYNYTVDHPKGTGYNSIIANFQMHKFLHCSDAYGRLLRCLP